MAREQHVIAAKHQHADLIFLAHSLGDGDLLGIAIAREVERALTAAVEIECRKGLRLGIDDGIAPACRKMNAAGRAGGSVGRPRAGSLRASGRDNHLGRIVGVEEPDRAIIEREQ